MKDNIEFKLDRKLDNKKESINVTLIELSYVMGDKKIKRKQIKCTNRTGWCLGGRTDGGLSVNIEDIGVLSESHSANTGAMNPRWNIFTYTHKESKALSLLKTELDKKRNSLLKLANKIPNI